MRWTRKRDVAGEPGWAPNELTRPEFEQYINSELQRGTEPTRLIIETMRNINVSLDDLKEFFSKILKFWHVLTTPEKVGGFSNATYSKVAPYFGLDPSGNGADIVSFDLQPFYLPNAMFDNILYSINLHHYQYGTLREVFNESGVLHYIRNVFPPSFVIDLCSF